MYRYIYDGPVKEFNKVITEKLKGETMAVSERKNNVYRYGGMDL